MRKSLALVLVLTSTLAVPCFAAAQGSEALTRAEVKADLVRLERAGYIPGRDRNTYPAGIQLAETRVTEQRDAVSSSYGSLTAGSASYGAPQQAPALSRSATGAALHH